MVQSPDLPPLLGESPSFLAAMERLSQLAEVDRPLLVIGERGTGKELAARRVHALSRRWDGPLITVNCAALTPELLDSELFGHEAGAFTGAARRRRGRFEQADNGTLFLDELGTAPAPVQEKLLRVLEYGRFPRVGGEEDIAVDVRVIAATNADLPAMAADGRFRADLLDRLAFDVITLPPLRARLGDIPLLAFGFGRRMAVELGWDGFPGFTETAAQALLGHNWPGNLRELRNVVERAVVAHGRDDVPIQEIVLDPFDSPFRPLPLSDAPKPAEPKLEPEPEPEPQPTPLRQATPAFPLSLKAHLEAEERRLVEAALSTHKHNRRQAADALGLSYDQLRGILRRLEPADGS